MSVDVTDEQMTGTTETTDTPVGTIGEPVVPAEQVVEVRRRAGVAVLLGAGASLVAIAYLARAVASGGILDWVLFAVLGAIGVANLAALLDARIPLLVADELGVRLRLGRTWVGLPWGGLDLVEHRPRRGWWRDGLLVIRPRYVQRVLEDLDPAARRTARVNRRVHRAPLAVPLGLATRVLGADPDLTAALQALAGGRTEIAEPAVVEPDVVEDAVTEPVTEPDVDETPAYEAIEEAQTVDETPVDDEPIDDEPVDAGVHPSLAERLPELPHLHDPRPRVARLIGDLATRFDRKRGRDEDLGWDDDYAQPPAEEPEADEPVVASETPAPARETVVAARAEVRHESRTELPIAAPEPRQPLEEDTQLWSDLHLDVVPHEGPLLIDDYAARPADDPVIGPQFAGARERLGLTVDQLAERTRVRPHVIESIEVDDFSACGGDFYARGHLRTLARVLGVDVTPLLATYDERYADAPIDPRRVFEAELSGAGSLRATRGGPNWSVLVAAVMALILCWSIARLLTDGPSPLPDRAVLSGSGGPNQSAAPAAKPVPVVVKAAGGGARVVVRNGVGTVVFSGDLSFGQSHALRVSPPVRVQATDGSVRVTVAGQDRGPMGPSGRPASTSYVVRR